MQTMINNDVKTAVAILRAGGLVAFPTETVYGLGADARNEAAVRRVFSAKNRPYDHPLIVHLPDADAMKEWAEVIPPAALALAAAFWPGPLTLVLQKQAHVLDIVTGGQETVALRVPNHPQALALLKEFNGGLVAPSANQFTHISPTTAMAVQEELGDVVDIILDGGDCTVGVESTIVDVSNDDAVILRPGMISTEQIGRVLGKPVPIMRQDNATARAPGMHHLHYAPQTKTQVMPRALLLAYLDKLPASALPVAVVLCGEDMTLPQQCHLTTLPANAKAYAQAIYRTLRELDHAGFKRIIIEAVPEGCQWEAIRDRLSKASGDR